MHFIPRSTQIVAATASPSLLAALAYVTEKIQSADKKTENKHRNNFTRHRTQATDEIQSTSHGELLNTPSFPVSQFEFLPLDINTARKLPRRIARNDTQAKTTKHSLHDRFDIQPIPLASGACGTVHQAVDKCTGEKVAVKMIPRTRFCSASLRREIKALTLIKSLGGHNNICGLREVFRSSDDGYIYLVLDLVPGGDLLDQLVSNGAYCEKDAARLIMGVVRALAYLHNVGIVHSDLKPENLMLSTDTTSDAVIKVVDFGSANILDEEEEEENAANQSFTPAYCPPEVLEKTSDLSERPAHDTWSVGVILYIMLTGVHPFDHLGTASDKEVETRIKNRQLPPLENSSVTAHLSKSAIDLLGKLLHNEPARRINCFEMLEHPWLREEKTQGN